jgi:uncharacterized membrane protein YuzA (DUF378 family)
MNENHAPAALPADPTGRGSRLARVATTAALLLLIIGGLNWALVGLFNVDVVAALFGPMTTPARIVYAVVGVAALYALTLLPRLLFEPPADTAR